MTIHRRTHPPAQPNLKQKKEIFRKKEWKKVVWKYKLYDFYGYANWEDWTKTIEACSGLKSQSQHDICTYTAYRVGESVKEKEMIIFL